MKIKLIKTTSGMEVRIWQGEEPKQRCQHCCDIGWKNDIEPCYKCNFGGEFKSIRTFQEKHNEWLSSYKSYPVRSEDEEGFHKLAHEAVDMIAASEYFIALSQGIEIPSERVKIEWLVSGNGPCGLNFATLLTEDKEGEGQSDAVEFAEWCKNNYESVAYPRSLNDRNEIWVWEKRDTITSPQYTTQELYKLFKQ